MQFTEDEMGMPIEHPLAGRNVGPGRRNACAADASPKKNSHVHVVSTGKADALQWKLDLDDVPIAGQLRCAVPKEIRFPPLARRWCIQRIHLNPVGIDNQVIRSLSGIGGVETESDPVIIEDTVAAADCGADLRRFGIEAVKGEVKILVVVDQPDLCLEYQFFAV